MKDVIRIHDKTTSSGKVLSGSSTMKFDGIGVARKGDPVECPVHGRTVIAESHPTFKDNGMPMAFHGHHCACGCTLISSLPRASAS